MAPSGFRSVLVPLDLTPGVDRVLGRVGLLSVIEDARVTLLHVVPRGLPAHELRDAERDATKFLAEEARHLRRALPAARGIDPLVRIGPAAKEIVACANKVKADVIVMGRGRARPVREAFLGSTAERVVRQARVPVLVVRQPAREPYRRPAMALDVDPAAGEVVRQVLRLLPVPWPRIDVIHALDAPYRGMYPSLSRRDVEHWEVEARARMVRELREELADALEAARIRPEAAPFWKLNVRYGSPRTVVERALRQLEPDLLALGTRGYTGAPYIFLGSVAGDLLRAAKCDVMVVPPPART